MNGSNTNQDRRTFLKQAAAAGAAVPAVASAGCLGDDEETELDDPDEAGESFPEWTYYNNPEDYNPARHDVINLIAEQWDEVGFDIEVEVLEWGTLIDLAVFEYDFDFTTWTQFQTPDPALITASRLTPEHAEEPGLGNYNQYANERVGELVDEQLEVDTVDERAEAFYEIQEIVAEDVPMTPIVYATQLMPYRTDQLGGWEERVQGFQSLHNYAAVEPTDENEDGFLRGFWTEALENMNPWSHEGLSKHINLQDALQMRVANLDADLELDPEFGMAQEFSRPDDTTIVFEIRDDVDWSDGEPVTAEDVAFTYQTIADVTPPQNSTLAGFVESAEVIDGDSVEVNLTQSMGAAALSLVGYTPFIKAKHVWEDVELPYEELVEDPVCSGPFEVSYWDPGQEIELTARDDHPLDVSINGIFWEIIPESSTIWSYTEDATINYHPFAQPGRELAEATGEAEGEEGLDNFDYEEAPGNGWTHLNMNVRTPGLDETAVRQALAEAVPKETASEQMWYGFYPPGHSWIAPVYEPLYNDDIQQWGEGTEAAIEHLQDNGFVVTDDGVHYPAE